MMGGMRVTQTLIHFLLPKIEIIAFENYFTTKNTKVSETKFQLNKNRINLNNYTTYGAS